ncbi:hypothetical protein [Mycolicibacterium aichiense]|uniref:SseB protein N-terminal domain-containing protein n=1 Tax=Mycolicibacterium aichiense TaxID=1799 RepID=A0AAD1HMQ2_9MYCO|nr:hypothetical protein [Mycolicibacterium aichiense]MCV7020420.1 hypothetical protein [Mycolicibacterium aichiense]BBX07931.1 hypothetical protein MAIC_27340 [Mycolicibacterium aichiense]STZ81741.1 Uncharacterised protein [Mycolicibacterium aichiense]
MGLFRKTERRNPDPAETHVYYSTPFGDTDDGNQKLFFLQREGVLFMPVFLSVDSMKEFYRQSNRAAYAVLQGDVTSVSDLIRSIDVLKGAGIVIEPLSANPIEIPPTA